MTNTIKEGKVAEPAVVLADVPNGRSHLSVLEEMELSDETQLLRKTQEKLAVLPLLRAVELCGLAQAMSRRALHLATVIATAFVNSAAFAQPEVIRCLPPEVPVTDLPQTVLSEYRTEIVAEFEAYFAAVSTHIACLDAERNRALSEAHIATETYSTFLNPPTAQKDFP